MSWILLSRLNCSFYLSGGVFFSQAKDAILEVDPYKKIVLTQTLYEHLLTGKVDMLAIEPPCEISIPGRPVKPELVHPSQVARRKLTTEAGRIALIHAVCHIEFNAINLALDAVYRFRDMPQSYYEDWLRVACEESKHFSLLSDRLQGLSASYGDLPAHNGLWEMAIKTQHSVIERMALVPRVLEARGLDVTPGMIERLQSVGDEDTVEILKIILSEEVGHVEIGTRWFHYGCQQAGYEPEATFIALLDKYAVASAKGPLHVDARRRAGFTRAEMKALLA